MIEPARANPGISFSVKFLLKFPGRSVKIEGEDVNPITWRNPEAPLSHAASAVDWRADWSDHHRFAEVILMLEHIRLVDIRMTIV